VAFIENPNIPYGASQSTSNPSLTITPSITLVGVHRLDLLDAPLSLLGCQKLGHQSLVGATADHAKTKRLVVHHGVVEMGRQDLADWDQVWCIVTEHANDREHLLIVPSGETGAMVSHEGDGGEASVSVGTYCRITPIGRRSKTPFPNVSASLSTQTAS
jgi:hypothetical protein